MNKVVAFLEQYVQWLALGLGGLYLGYMIWTYAVQTPVVITGVAATPLTPGAVDQHILDNAALPLDRAMKVPTVPEMVVPNFIDRFKSDMALSDFPVFAFVANPDSQVIPVKLVKPSDALVHDTQPINALPTLPAATVLDSSNGRSNVQPFAPAAAAGGPPANGVQPVAGNADKSWVTVSYSISAAQLRSSFHAASIPPWTDHTTMLQVQLWREESVPGGKWSDPKLITPINIQSLQPFPAGGVQGDETAYLTWAVAHVGDILQPAFYIVNKGDPWHAPGQVINVVNQPTALPPLDPTQDYPPGVVAQYPADQRLAYFQAHSKLKSQNAPRGARRGPQGPPQGGPPGGPQQGGPPQGRANPADSAAGTEVFADSFQPPTIPMPNGQFQGVPPMPGNGPPGAPAPADLAAQFPIPAGDFDPNSLAADITGWAHDDSAAPGHTYRYMITYQIKNPIYRTNAAKNKPELTAIFALRSPDGLWSKPINVASTTNFFVSANSRPGAATARFKVYKWQNGVERSKVFEVGPGDMIGGKDGDSDFDTGWTIVDIRFDDPKNPDSMTVIVMDPNGILDRRDYRTDQAKPELKGLDQQVSSATAADQLAGSGK